jgi:hypothetical protein
MHPPPILSVGWTQDIQHTLQSVPDVGAHGPIGSFDGAPSQNRCQFGVEMWRKTALVRGRVKQPIKNQDLLALDGIAQ